VVQKIHFVLLYGTLQDGQTKTFCISNAMKRKKDQKGQHHMFVAHHLLPVSVHLMNICYDFTEIKI